jgi:hypothetical protein
MNKAARRYPAKINPTGIRIGDSTHHHDQVIYPVSFNVMKIRVRIGRKGKLFEASIFDITLYFYYKIRNFTEGIN